MLYGQTCENYYWMMQGSGEFGKGKGETTRAWAKRGGERRRSDHGRRRKAGGGGSSKERGDGGTSAGRGDDA